MWRAVVAGLLWATTAMAAPNASQGFDVRNVVTGVTQPTAVAFLPNGQLLIAQKGGQLRLWSRRGGLRPDPVIRIPTCSQSEMGLLGIAVDPDFASSGFVYLYHTQPPAGDPARCAAADGRTNRVVRVTMSGETAANLTVLLDGIRTDNGNHDGGGLRIGPDGYLYIGAGDTGKGDFGDPGDATNPYAQDRQSLNGKLLRITRTGEPAPGNPFINEGGNARYVFAYGLRNPFRFNFEPVTELLWIGDVGQNTFEEVDIARGGENFGWPQCEGFEPTSSCPGSTTSPVYVYQQGDAGSSITGGVFYTHTLFGAAYQGNYFFADYVLDKIFRAVPRHAPDGFVGPPEVFVEGAGSPVDFALAADGSLYYAAYAANAVRRVLPQSGTSAPCARSLGIRTAGWSRQAGAAVARCQRKPGDDAECFPPEKYTPQVPRALARRIDQQCGSAPPPELCSRLLCAPCVATSDLTQCIAQLITDFVITSQSDLTGADDGRCGRTMARVVARGAAERLAAYQRCRVRSETECTPPALGPALARKIARACNDPSTAVCDAIGCNACGNGAALADCTSVWVAGAVDDLALALDGAP